MSDSVRRQKLGFATGGAKVRRATEAVERESEYLAAALRRAIPFLTQHGIAVTLAYAKAASVLDVIDEVSKPVYLTEFVVNPTGGKGSLLLDGGAVAIFLDGVLGGDGKSLPTLNPEGLTSPQVALVARLADGIFRAFADVANARFGIELVSPAVANADETGGESVPIACALKFTSESHTGHVVLLLEKEAVVPPADEETKEAFDSRVAAVLDEVELELVVELGRLRKTLSEVSKLCPGDMLRLRLPVNGPVAVRAGDHIILTGRPTTSGGQIAVRIERHDP